MTREKPETVDALAVLDAEVIDAEGEATPLSSHLHDGPVLLMFLRHFGCIGCSMNMAELAPRLPELADLGVQVVFIGNGPVAFLAGFIDEHQLEGRDSVVAVTDPTLGIFAKAGLLRSFWATAGPRAVVDFAKGLTDGHWNRAIEGDWWQQGGAMFLAQDRTVLHYHRSESLAGHESPSELVHVALTLFAKANAGSYWKAP